MTLKTYTPAELAEILEAHRKHQRGAPDGVRADLSYADLSYADLRGANLSGANLGGAKNLPEFQIPQDGALVGYKKLREGVVAKLLIPAGAKRTASLVGRKCRAEFAEVLELSGGAKEAHSLHDATFIYRVGEIVRPDAFCDDIREECRPGIHFFQTREEAERYAC